MKESRRGWSAWKQGLVDAIDLIQSYEDQLKGYGVAKHVLYYTGELDCEEYREGWKDGIEHMQYLEEVLD